MKRDYWLTFVIYMNERFGAMGAKYWRIRDAMKASGGWIATHKNANRVQVYACGADGLCIHAGPLILESIDDLASLRHRLVEWHRWAKTANPGKSIERTYFVGLDDGRVVRWHRVTKWHIEPHYSEVPVKRIA